MKDEVQMSFPLAHGALYSFDMIDEYGDGIDEGYGM